MRVTPISHHPTMIARLLLLVTCGLSRLFFLFELFIITRTVDMWMRAAKRHHSAVKQYRATVDSVVDTCGQTVDNSGVIGTGCI